MDEEDWRFSNNRNNAYQNQNSFDGGYWNSPSARGYSRRGPRVYSSPRYDNHWRGGRGRWPQHSSPYHSSPFRPPLASSTPRHYYQQRPRFSTGQRDSFHYNSPNVSFHTSTKNELGIEEWISPLMWEDPWEEFTQMRNTKTDLNSTTQLAISGMTDITETTESESFSSEILGISDMIMTSMDESKVEPSSSDPLPDISLEINPIDEKIAPSKEQEKIAGSSSS